MRQTLTNFHVPERHTAPQPQQQESIMFKANYQLVQLKVSDILFIKALADYVIIKTTTGKFITLSTMKDMADSLPGDKFVRTHRSFIVNKEKIHMIKGSSITVSDNGFQYTIPIGRAYKKDFKQSLNA